MILRHLALLVPLACVSALSIGCSSDSDGDGDGAGGTSNGGGGSANGGGGTANGGGGSANGGTGGTGDTCPSLAPTGTPHKLIISQVVPGVGIEVFNAGTTAVDVDDVWFCSSFDYQNANATSGKTSIAPGAFVVMDWPDTANYALATSTAGELLLYADSEFPDPENLQSYVCWGGYVDGTGRKTDALDAEIYTDDCAAALTNGAISRKPGTNGLGQDSYDTAAAPALADCPL